MTRRILFSLLLIGSLISGCQPQTQHHKEQQSQVKQTTYNQSNRHMPNLAGGSEYANRIPHPLSLSDLHKKYKSNFILNGSIHKREIALTFDDAPDNFFTPQILDALKKEKVKATFFIVGNRAEKYPKVVQRILREGHAIGNHSYNHANFSELNDKQFRSQITRTDNIFQRQIGYRPLIVRPPYGNVTENQIKWLVSQHKRIVNWNVDSLDWKGLNAEQVSANILADIQPGAIILQHSAGGKGENLTGTVRALPKIVQKLRKDGVKFVTVPEMLDI